MFLQQGKRRPVVRVELEALSNKRLAQCRQVRGKLELKLADTALRLLYCHRLKGRPSTDELVRQNAETPDVNHAVVSRHISPAALDHLRRQVILGAADSMAPL